MNRRTFGDPQAKARLCRSSGTPRSRTGVPGTGGGGRAAMQEAGPSGKQVHEQCSVPLKRGETESRRSHAQGQVSAAAGPGFGSSARIPEDGGAEPPLGALLPLSCSGVPVRGAPLCEWAQGGSHGRPADRVPPPRWLRLPRTTRVWSSDSWGPLLGTPPPSRGLAQAPSAVPSIPGPRAGGPDPT